MGRFLAGQRPALRLGRTLFLIKEIVATPEGSTWADYATFGAICARAEEKAGQPLVGLEFLSPTAFSFGQRPWGKQIQVLPEPRLVFGSLARAWQAFAPPGLGLEVRRVRAYVEENVVIQRLEGLETRMLHFGRYPQVGFVGRVTYRVMDKTSEAAAWRRTMHALAEFSFYAGVGYKTTMGMGQCRAWE
jgi:CRISPR-associated endoribonuclease Cas6